MASRTGRLSPPGLHSSKSNGIVGRFFGLFVVGFGKEVGIGTAVVVVGRAYAFDDGVVTDAEVEQCFGTDAFQSGMRAVGNG